MSVPPGPPDRLLWKNSRWPSMDRAGAASAAVELRVDRFTGVCQAQPAHARWDTQRSFPPAPPGRFDVKYRLSSAGDRVGCDSSAPVLIGSPTFTGLDHPDLAKACAWIRKATGSDSASQASRRVARGNDARMRDARDIQPPGAGWGRRECGAGPSPLRQKGGYASRGIPQASASA